MMEFSPLGKTWILDVDGTIVKHNGHLNGGDVLLDGVKEFFDKINPNDKIILLTARNAKHKENLEKFLNDSNIRYDSIIYDTPTGERILINDEKPSGLKMAYAINKPRDSKFSIDYKINSDL